MVGSLDETSFEDLDTRGFVLIRDFLSPDDIAFLRADAARAPSAGNRNYELKAASADAEALLDGRIDEVLERVNTRTTLRVDSPAGASYFATGVADGVDFPWHQDHESYFVLQNHHDYLNFYMPIVKPDVTRSNLCLLPFDVLEREAPEVHRMALRSGARHFHAAGGRWFSLSDETGAIRLMPKHLGELEHTPHLSPGDLLLFRGDMLHRTQDAETARVALSIRRVGSHTPISRTRLASGGVRKALMMSNFPLPYQHLFAAFAASGREVMTYEELSELGATVPPPEPVGRKAFLRMLLVQKWQTHTLPSFLLDAPRAAALRLLQEAQGRVHARKLRRAG